jgi:hypothetical protein
MLKVKDHPKSQRAGESGHKSSDRSRRKASSDVSEFDRTLGALGGVFPMAAQGDRSVQSLDQYDQTSSNTNVGVAGLKSKDQGSSQEHSLEEMSVDEKIRHMLNDPNAMAMLKRGASTLSYAQGLVDESGESGSESLFQVASNGAHGDLTQVNWDELNRITGGILASELKRAGGAGGESETPQSTFIQTLNGLARISTPSEKKEGNESGPHLIEGMGEMLKGQVSEGDSSGFNPIKARKEVGMNLGVVPQWLSQSLEQKSVNSLKSNDLSAVVNHDQFSEQTIQLMSQQVMKTYQKGGGEFKMRLNPRELGEMTIHVRATGSEVALKIQASNHRVKEILEGSMNALKEKLSHQQLVLANCDVSIIPATPDDQSHFSRQFLTSDENLSQGWSQGLFQHQNSNDDQSRFIARERDSSSDGVSIRRSQLPTLNPIITAKSYSTRAGQLDLHA